MKIPLTILIFTVFVLSLGEEALMRENSQRLSLQKAGSGELEKQLLEKANASVMQTGRLAEKDPLYPQFHLRTAANWINDPNGPVFFNGEYHIFFQHNPYGDRWGNMSWGHAVSRDLVFWKHLPIVLTPGPGSYDEGGIFSGCCVVERGIPTIVYTSVRKPEKNGYRPETQSIARSIDGLRSWVKFEGNPVVARKPLENLVGFRDPFVWKDGEMWNMVLGSGIKGVGGTILLYKSKDLKSWDFIGPLCSGFGEMWECPNFFELGDKWVLVVSPYGEVKYSVGEFKDNRFYPGEWYRIDFGGRAGFYAPNSFLTPDGRRIMWGWITGGGSEGYPWNGMLTVPRVLSLGKNKRLEIKPAGELTKLRGKHYHFEDILLEPNKPNDLSGLQGDCLEINAEINVGGSREVAIELLVSPDGREKTSIVYDNQNLLLKSGDKQGSFQLLPGEKYLKLHIFLDKSVVEVFANDRACLTMRTYPKNPESKGIRLISQKRAAIIGTLDIWRMKTIWQ